MRKSNQKERIGWWDLWLLNEALAPIDLVPEKGRYLEQKQRGLLKSRLTLPSFTLLPPPSDPISRC